ncbi:hypothetical protein HZA44_00750, partial [Candidatus Peregrinibacteria bacterium]|nr:hypothetical protein [Candidatus Peregrinibacteria bacterium]
MSSLSEKNTGQERQANENGGARRAIENILKNRWAGDVTMAAILALGISQAVCGGRPDTNPYEMTVEDKQKNDEVNEKVMGFCAGAVMVGPNRMCAQQVTPEVDRESPLVEVVLPGKDVNGNPQRPIMRKQAVEGFWKTVQDCRKKTGIMLIVNSAFRFNHVQDRLFVSLPGLASPPGYGRHAIDAVDISRKSANEKQPNPMTLDTSGKVIFLEDLETAEGKKRFAEVVMRINAEEIAQHPERKDRIVEAWTKTAKTDFDKNVWGAMDACMESFQQFGSSISHCGMVSNSTKPKALRESWHAEPPRGGMVECKRWDKTYNANMIMYRKYPPIAEDEYFKRMKSSY